MIEDVICKTVAILSRPQCYKFLHTKWFPLLQMGDFLNLDRIIQDWAWREYERTASKSQLKLLAKERRKPGTCLHPHIDWSEVKCTDVTTWPQVTEELFKASDSTDNNNRLFQRDDTHAASTVLFRTKFTNDTDDDQEYMMKTEKTTRSSCTIEVESGFTHGVAMSVGLKTPCEIFEANVGYCCEMTLTDTEGQTFEEEITWGVESLIKVKANHVADAQLVVNEKKVLWWIWNRNEDSWPCLHYVHKLAWQQLCRQDDCQWHHRHPAAPRWYATAGGRTNGSRGDLE